MSENSVKQKVSKKFSYLLLAVSIVSGVGGALLLGEILHSVARIAFGLSEEQYVSLVIPVIGLFILGVTGTAALAFSFFVENKVVKVLIILFSVLIPIIIEVIDLTIRFFIITDELLTVYPELTMVLQ